MGFVLNRNILPEFKTSREIAGCVSSLIRMQEMINRIRRDSYFHLHPYEFVDDSDRAEFDDLLEHVMLSMQNIEKWWEKVGAESVTLRPRL